MTIEDRIKEIEGRLDNAPNGGWITVSKWEQSKQDITLLLSELKRCREALELASEANDIDEGTGIYIVPRHEIADRAKQALHPEGVK